MVIITKLLNLAWHTHMEFISLPTSLEKHLETWSTHGGSSISILVGGKKLPSFAASPPGWIPTSEPGGDGRHPKRFRFGVFFWPLASLNKSIPYAPHAPYSMVYSHISAIFTKKLFIKWPKCRWKMVKIDEHSIWDWLTADCPTFWWSPSWPRVQLVDITRILSWSVWFHQRKEWNILGMS